MEILFGLVLTLTAAVVGVWHVASRDRPLHGPADDGTLGLPHLQRWSDTQPKRRFGKLRESVPLIDGGRIIFALGGLVLVAGIAAGAYFAWQRVTDPGSGNLENQLGEIVTLHARANASSDAATRYALLIQAEASAAASMEGASSQDLEAIEVEYLSIQSDLDRMTRMVRIETIQPVGGVPVPGTDVEPMLFHGAGRTYLLSDALYEVDVGSAQLIRLIEPGDGVNGVTVGTLLSGTWRGDAPLVIDAERAYTFDHTRGEWDWESLGTQDGEAVTAAVQAIGVFDLNLYIVDGHDGRILKFAGGDYEADPEDWAPGVASEELHMASDVYVDGNIYALLPNGTVMKFFLNGLEALLAPKIQPPFDSASALIPTNNGFYIVNGSDGRIAQISSDGTLVQQYAPLDPEQRVEGMRDVVIDESTGIALMLSDDGIYTTRLVAGGS